MIDLIKARMAQVEKQFYDTEIAPLIEMGRQMGLTDEQINWHINRAMRDAYAPLHGFGPSPDDWPTKYPHD